MSEDRHIWRIWAQTLHRWGLQDLVAVVLEAAGPLTTLGAQVVYLGQPIFASAVHQGSLKALANMLEESAETRAFVDYLRESNQRESD